MTSIERQVPNDRKTETQARDISSVVVRCCRDWSQLGLLGLVRIWDLWARALEALPYGLRFLRQVVRPQAERSEG